MKARIAIVICSDDYRVRYFANKECEVAILGDRLAGGPFDAIIYVGSPVGPRDEIAYAHAHPKLLPVFGENTEDD
jgi:hypothetical protein